MPNFVQICSKLWPCIRKKEQTGRHTHKFDFIYKMNVLNEYCNIIRQALMLFVMYV